MSVLVLAKYKWLCIVNLDIFGCPSWTIFDAFSPPTKLTSRTFQTFTVASRSAKSVFPFLSELLQLFQCHCRPPNPPFLL